MRGPNLEHLCSPWWGGSAICTFCVRTWGSLRKASNLCGSGGCFEEKSCFEPACLDLSGHSRRLYEKAHFHVFFIFRLDPWCVLMVGSWGFSASCTVLIRTDKLLGTVVSFLRTHRVCSSPVYIEYRVRACHWIITYEWTTGFPCPEQYQVRVWCLAS